jgi:ribosomal protein S18 acetylase RimI-like enzyme
MVERLGDKSVIRRLLEREREWALYALADLDDGLFEQCDWWGCGGGLALVFHGLDIRPIFLMGSASEAGALLSALPTASGYLNLQPHMQRSAEGVYTFRRRHEMCRMILRRFAPKPGPTVLLSPADLADIEALYASGPGAGIAFAPVQLKSGFFRGIREDGTLVAVAGVQVVSLAEGVAAVGNVFVRQDRRGQGLAQTVLSATVAAVVEAGVRTIGLNAEHTNAPAVRAYEALGFRTALRYVEGMADRVAPP